MATIGFVKKNGTGYKGEIRTLSVKAPIEIVRNSDKTQDHHPDYRVVAHSAEIGAGWVRVGGNSNKEYLSLSFAAPEFGARKLYANLGRAAGQDDDDVFSIIWNPAD